MQSANQKCIKMLKWMEMKLNKENKKISVASSRWIKSMIRSVCFREVEKNGHKSHLIFQFVNITNNILYFKNREQEIILT